MMKRAPAEGDAQNPLPLAPPTDAAPDPQLPAHGRYLLLSDLHLGDGGRTDLFGAGDRALRALLEERAPRCDAMILNGDVLDAHQARRLERVRRGHGPLLELLARIAERIPIYHVIGNHDDAGFIDALLPATRRCQAVCIGDQALVLHGHQFDIHFEGGPLAGEGGFALWAHHWFERLTGQFVRLPFGEHPNLANRFAHWTFYRFTMAWHRLAQALAHIGRPRLLQRWAAHHDYWARSQWGDTQALLLPTLVELARSPFRILVTGHSHQAGIVREVRAAPSERVTGEPSISWRDPARQAPDVAALCGRAMVNLGSWTFGESTFGEWSDGELHLRDFCSGLAVDDRTYHLALRAPAIPGMREWWQRYYRGLLRYDIERVRLDRREILPLHQRAAALLGAAAE